MPIGHDANSSNPPFGTKFCALPEALYHKMVAIKTIYWIGVVFMCVTNYAVLNFLWQQLITPATLSKIKI
jgi:hypothetical protein